MERLGTATDLRDNGVQVERVPRYEPIGGLKQSVQPLQALPGLGW
jgi:hypothetical protein